MLKQELWVNTTDKNKLYVKTWGDERLTPIVLVHGYPDNQEVWSDIIPALIDKFYVISYDVRGAGQSSLPRKFLSYRLAQLANDLESVVTRVIPNRPYHLAAHDWGSIQSWEAVTEPRFKGHILSYTTISGPCLDHAAFWMRKKFNKQPDQFFKQLVKSWYVMLFHLPWVAPTFWRHLSVPTWTSIFQFLENNKNINGNDNIAVDGRYGVNLYRANFIPSLTQPRQRFAQCPVQAIVLDQDKYVSPELVEEMRLWVDDLSIKHVDANHWAIVSQPEKIANFISEFALKY